MFNSTSFLSDIINQLKSLSDSKTRESSLRFFKESIVVYGVKSAFVQKLARDKRKEIKDLDKETIFGLCEELFKSDYCEEAFVACNRSYALRKQYERDDFQTFYNWIEKYINNRAKCDTFCNHTIGAFIEMYPEYIQEIKQWTKSSNRRVKRASAVSFIVPAKRGMFLGDVFRIADSLLLDSDDMVQKGYGWMLKVASKTHEKEVFDYVMEHKTVMPRTALRYAIEKMDKKLKVAAMKR